MAPLDPKPTKVSEVARDHLRELRKALVRQGVAQRLNQEDITSALILYTPPAQVAWALREYWLYTGKLASDEDLEGDDGDGN